jgi:hypothetical protein
MRPPHMNLMVLGLCDLELEQAALGTDRSGGTVLRVDPVDLTLTPLHLDTCI